MKKNNNNFDITKLLSLNDTQMIINPCTGRPITVNGKIYNKLVNDGIIDPNNHCKRTKKSKKSKN
jgi:hypothetical protein